MSKYNGIVIENKYYRWKVYKTGIINSCYINKYLGTITTDTRSERKAVFEAREHFNTSGIKVLLEAVVTEKYKMTYSELKDYVIKNGEKTVIESMSIWEE